MTAFPDEILALAARLIGACQAKDLKVAAAESCTGGLVMGSLTAVPGSSAAVDRGFVTYSNEAKVDILGVPAAYLVAGGPGAVSAEVVRAMAEGALRASAAQISAATTGIAGPTGGTPEKPVGLVYVAAARTGFETIQSPYNFAGDRDSVRMQTVAAALEMMLRQVDAP